MLIVDAQVHIWGSGTLLPPHRETSVFSKDELLKEMDAAGVHHAHAMQLKAVRDDVHGRAPVADGARQGADYVPRSLHMARLEAASPKSN